MFRNSDSTFRSYAPLAIVDSVRDVWFYLDHEKPPSADFPVAPAAVTDWTNNRDVSSVDADHEDSVLSPVVLGRRQRQDEPRERVYCPSTLLEK